MFAPPAFRCHAPLTRTDIGLGEGAYVASLDMHAEANHAVAGLCASTRPSTRTFGLRTSWRECYWKFVGEGHRLPELVSEAMDKSR